MTPLLHSLTTPQATKIYQLLSLHDKLTAAEIGEHLDILPNAVYRAAKQLLALGVVRKTDDYPSAFERVSSETALAWYLLAARRNFLQAFPPSAKATKHAGPSITFIKDRSALLQLTDRDAARAERSINFIVSGLEVPDQTILAYRKASAKGVTIRALVQRQHETSQDKLERWQDIGATVRVAADLGLRLFVFDKRIVYLTSYSLQTTGQAFGIRFDYAPVAIAMDELFTEHWARAATTG